MAKKPGENREKFRKSSKMSKNVEKTKKIAKRPVKNSEI